MNENKESVDKILVVDDNICQLQMMEYFLRKQGWHTVLAEDGESALTIVDAQMPDLILLDVEMPGIDGFEVCRRLQSSNRTRHIPIMFITGNSDPEDEFKGLELGAIDYIFKPFRIQALKAKIKNHLRLKRFCDGRAARCEKMETRINEPPPGTTVPNLHDGC